MQIVSAIPEKLPPIQADPECLANAINNVLDNAVKYSPQCKTVWIDASQLENHVAIKIRDQGIGISQEDRDHIFERFYRGSHQSYGKIRGSGLGLSLVQDVLSAQGGYMDFESRIGYGSTFTLFLKISDPSDKGQA